MYMYKNDECRKEDLYGMLIYWPYMCFEDNQLMCSEERGSSSILILATTVA